MSDMTLTARMAETVTERDLDEWSVLGMCDAEEVVVNRRSLMALVALARQARAAEREAFMRAAQEVRSFLADEPLEAFTRLPEAIESLADRDWRSEEEA